MVKFIFDFIFKHILLKPILALFSTIFSDENSCTRNNLLVLVASFFVLNGVFSIHSSFIHCLILLSNKKLNTYYHSLKGSKLNLDDWAKQLIKIAISLIPENCKYPIFLIIDDTLVSKFGKFFEGISKLYDHSAHNGETYINGHCFVCLVLMIPVQIPFSNKLKYIRIPICFRMWKTEKTNENSSNSKNKLEKKKAKRTEKQKVEKENHKNKLEIARKLCELVKSIIGDQRNIVVLADSWYPKGALRDFVVENSNVAGIFNVRIDTAIYDLPTKELGKRGRPPKKGAKLSVSDDFDMKDIPGTDYRVGYRQVLTRLFGIEKVVTAVVTETKETQSRRLYICTDPEMSTLDVDLITDSTANAIGTEIKELLCFCAYSFRWNIEIVFQEQKRFWGLCDYKVRTEQGIESLINLQSVTYAVLCLLPYLDTAFAELRNLSIQERRFEIGRLMERQMYFGEFLAKFKDDQKYCDLAQECAIIARSQTDFSHLQNK